MTSVGSVELRPKVMTADEDAPASVANQAPAHSSGLSTVSTLSHRKGENTIRSEENGTVTFWTLFRATTCALTEIVQWERRIETQRTIPKTVLTLVTSAKGNTNRNSWGIVHIHEAVCRTSDARDCGRDSVEELNRVRARTESSRSQPHTKVE